MSFILLTLLGVLTGRIWALTCEDYYNGDIDGCATYDVALSQGNDITSPYDIARFELNAHFNAFNETGSAVDPKVAFINFFPLVVVPGTNICYEMGNNGRYSDCINDYDDMTANTQEEKIKTNLKRIEDKYEGLGEVFMIPKLVEKVNYLQNLHTDEEKDSNYNNKGSNEYNSYSVQFVATVKTYSFVKKGMTIIYEKEHGNYNYAEPNCLFSMFPTYSTMLLNDDLCVTNYPMYLISNYTEYTEEEEREDPTIFDGVVFPLSIPKRSNLSVSDNLLSHYKIPDANKTDDDETLPDSIITDGKMYKTYFISPSSSYNNRRIGYVAKLSTIPQLIAIMTTVGFQRSSR